MELAHLSDTVKITKVSETKTVGVFDIDGLYRGYGITLGNAFRRVLLSSLPGAAITRFRVKGAGHQFTTLPGVMEDVVELGLNLRGVRFRFYADEPQTLILKIKGEKEVKAGDIKENAFVKIQNPEIHIATLTSSSAELDMELTVEKGLGYEPVEEQRVGRLPIGTIALDAVFSPVRKVNFRVLNMRVGERTDYNRIKLEIETDGTVSPSSALHKAANVLVDHFKHASEIEVLGEEEGAKKPALKAQKEPKEPKE